MNPLAIRVEGLSFRIDPRLILEQISFAIPMGEFVSVIGPNGAGKTTLIKCLHRILRATGGSIEILGKPLGRYSQRELAKVMSYVPQGDGRFFPFSVFEFVLMGRYPHLSPFSTITPEDKRAAERALEMTDTTAFRDRAIQTLSGGERQKVFIAAALAQGARILLLDEPTTFLDYRHQAEVMDLLRNLNRDEGLTLVAVTHDVNSGTLAGDRVLALKEGRLVFDGPPGDLLAGNALAAIYDTEFRFVQDPEGDAPIVLPRRARPV